MILPCLGTRLEGGQGGEVLICGDVYITGDNINNLSVKSSRLGSVL